MKVRVGITANIVKRRKMGDANSFVVKETEVSPEILFIK